MSNFIIYYNVLKYIKYNNNTLLSNKYSLLSIYI